MYKVLFVCHGNICRSPMAEFILKDMVKKLGADKKFIIESAATSTEEIGSPVYPRARSVLAKHKIVVSGKYARQFVRGDYDKYDYIIAMDEKNRENILKTTGGDAAGKVHMLLEYAGENRSVSDPWYTGDFDVAYEDIFKGCAALIDYILN